MPNLKLMDADVSVADDRATIGKWLRIQSALCVSRDLPVVISPELAARIADLLTTYA